MARLAVRAAAAGLAAVTLALLWGGWQLAGSSNWVRLLIVLLTAVAALAPQVSVLLLAATIPVAAPAAGATQLSLRLVELIVFCCLAGWALRSVVRPDGIARLSPAILRPLAMVALVAGLSGLVQLLVLRSVIGPEVFLREIWRTLNHDFFGDRRALQPAWGAMLVLTGEAVALGAAVLCAGRRGFGRQIARMFALGAIAAASLNVARLFEVALRSATPAAALLQAARLIRVNTAYSDVNAAGSFFAMSAFVALAIAGTARGVWKIPVIVGAFLVIAAAWLTGSRAAVAAILVAAAADIVRHLRTPSKRSPLAWAALGTCVLGAAVFIVAFPNRLVGSGTGVAVLVRQEMARVSFKIFREEPWFGVGLGEFYKASGPFLAQSPLAGSYKNENAHNTLLQWVAESGVVGTAALVWFLWSFARAVRSGPRDPDDRRLVEGLVLGLLAFSATALLGHPLLTTEVSLAFWLVAGTVVGLTMQRVQPSQNERLVTLLVAVAVAGIVAFTPWRVRAKVAEADLEHVGWGVSTWQLAPDGERFRRMTGPATLFIPTSPGWAEVPYRLSDEAGPTTVSLSFRGREADRLVLADHFWHRYLLQVPSRAGAARFEPLEISVIQGAATGVLLGRVKPRGEAQ